MPKTRAVRTDRADAKFLNNVSADSMAKLMQAILDKPSLTRAEFRLGEYCMDTL